MTDDQITIEIDGQSLPARKGQMVIEVADQAGIYIPRFCYHKKLSIAANCRMCLVDVEKAPKPLPACATPVMNGMKVRTRSDAACEAQKSVMEFLLINHPLDCPVCDQGGECELQDIALTYGSDVSRYTEAKRVVLDQNIGPLVSMDMTRCIHCTRCVRFGEEIAGLRELGATGRGEDMRIGTYVKHAMVSELSGNVIDVCPVGALNNKPYRFSARTWELVQHAAVGAHDCAGSNLYLHTLRGEVKRAVPRENEAINETWLADRDRYSCHALNSDRRVAAPQLKRKGQWQTVSWDEAFAEVSQRISETQRSAGSDAIGALISSSATLEEQYLLQKLMRALGSNHIDHRLQQYDFSLDQHMPIMPGLGVKIADLEKLHAALFIGSNVRKEQPIIGHRVRKAALAGAKIMFANHRRYELNYDADEYLLNSPEKLVTDLCAIVHALATVTNKTAPLGLAQRVAKQKIDPEHQRIATNLLQAEQAVVALGSQASMSPCYGELLALSYAIAELSGATWGMLSQGANAAGAWLAGAVPHRGTAGIDASEPGLTARAMLADPRKTYLLFGIEPELEAWDSANALQALQKAETVIACTSFDSPSMREYADIILPIAAMSETSGTYINTEGCWQSFNGAAKPFAEARPGWKVLRVLANCLDLPDFEYNSSEEICRTVAASCADIAVKQTIAGSNLPPNGYAQAEASLQRISDIPIYATDMLTRNSEPLQQTTDGDQANVVYIAPKTAEIYRVSAADTVLVKQVDKSIEMALRISNDIPEGCVWVGLGVQGTEGLGPAFGAIEVLPA